MSSTVNLGESLATTNGHAAKPLATSNFPIVGIGASAGGLEALEALFAAMPEETGMAFVVLQHLSPDFESRMDELLARRTRIPIQKVTDGVTVRPDNIYLIPPKKEMILSGGRLLLTDKDPARGLTLPIDQFLRSLAQDAGRRAIAVILSGTGSDGSRGVKDVHEAGGLVICQTPESARFDGMPRSALEAGVVDVELEPQSIPRVMGDYVKQPGESRRTWAVHRDQPTDEMGQIVELLRSEYGLDFAHYKPTTVLRRVERRINMGRQADVRGYVEQLRSDPAELNALYFDLLIGVTKFFRDRQAFDYLEKEIIPGLAARSDDLRLWVPGCATGEEVYSLAILLHEGLARRSRAPRVKIFATDVHTGSLERAATGIYDAEALADVSEARRERYFVAAGEQFRIAKELREMVVFARHNLISDAPFTRLDLVSCRNLLIYLQPAAQKKVLSLFHFGLRTGGVLFLGPSETPGELSDEFDPVDDHWKVFRKRRDVRLPAEMRLAVPVLGLPRPGRPATSGGRRLPDAFLFAAYDQLLARHMPPAFLVDEHYELLHSFGGAESILEFRGGRPSTNLLDLVSDELRGPLTGALQQAHRHGTATRYSGLDARIGETNARWRLTVEPLPDPKLDTTNFLVELEKLEEKKIAAAVEEVDMRQVSRDYVSSLEDELRSTKENLQATIEELETSNEELQATNEELVAANEELQSTNEELHSVNEELHTVNAEHQRKITELTELTNDMNSLLQSTDIGVVFLDEKLCVRKFTAKVERLFHLLPQDIGRKFDNFALAIDYPNLLSDLRQVVSTLAPVEREVSTGEGEVYLVRILPYRSRGEAGGVVLTLIDIGMLKRAEAEARRLSAIVRSAREAIVARDLAGSITAWNPGAEALYGWTETEAIGRDCKMLLPPDRVVEEGDLLARIMNGESVAPFETQRIGRDGRPLDVELSVSPVFDAVGRISGISTIARDIASRKRAEEQVKRAVAQRDHFLALLSHELRNPLMGLTNAVRVVERAETTSDVQGRALEVIRRQVAQMARLLEDLLDASRMRRDKVELRRELIDLRATVDGVMDNVRPLAAEAGVNVHVSVPSEALPVRADFGRLQQLQVNLLNNAVRYSPRGTTVHYTLAREHERAIIRVDDQGVGIPADILPHIFEPFFQGMQNGLGKEGMGLGLSLAQSIARAHDGELTAVSEGADKGSRFEAALPLAKASEEQRAPVSEEPLSERRPILLVDDDDDSRELLGVLLENLGHQVLHARTGGQGLELLRARRPRVAIVDIGLPDMSGLEVARAGRTTMESKEMKLIALTGFGQERDRLAALQAGFDLHLVKPVDIDVLEKMV